jgi:UDP-glucose 4-epimerase
LLGRLARSLGKKAILLPVPERFIRLIASLFGQRKFADRLCGSLQVDITKNRTLLGWIPPVKVDDALIKTAKHFQGASVR